MAHPVPDDQRVDDLETVYANRRKRFNDILGGYECGAGDWTMIVDQSREEAMRSLPEPRIPTTGPAAAMFKPGRWAVVTHSTRRHGYFVENVRHFNEISTYATRNLEEGWWPVCYFDLDVLAGEEMHLIDGDRVRYDGEERIVSHHDWEAAEGEPYLVIYLLPKDDQLYEGPIDPAEEEVELLERAMPDDRMPVRYGLASVVQVAVFNTIPSP